MKNGGSFHSYVNVYQRVSLSGWWFQPTLHMVGLYGLIWFNPIDYHT